MFINKGFYLIFMDTPEEYILKSEDFLDDFVKPIMNYNKNVKSIIDSSLANETDNSTKKPNSDSSKTLTSKTKGLTRNDNGRIIGGEQYGTNKQDTFNRFKNKTPQEIRDVLMPGNSSLKPISTESGSKSKNFDFIKSPLALIGGLGLCTAVFAMAESYTSDSTNFTNEIPQISVEEKTVTPQIKLNTTELLVGKKVSKLPAVTSYTAAKTDPIGIDNPTQVVVAASLNNPIKAGGLETLVSSGQAVASLVLTNVTSSIPKTPITPDVEKIVIKSYVPETQIKNKIKSDVNAAQKPTFYNICKNNLEGFSILGDKITTVYDTSNLGNILLAIKNDYVFNVENKSCVISDSKVFISEFNRFISDVQKIEKYDDSEITDIKSYVPKLSDLVSKL